MGHLSEEVGLSGSAWGWSDVSLWRKCRGIGTPRRPGKYKRCEARLEAPAAYESALHHLVDLGI